MGKLIYKKLDILTNIFDSFLIESNIVFKVIYQFGLKFYSIKNKTSIYSIEFDLQPNKHKIIKWIDDDNSDILTVGGYIENIYDIDEIISHIIKEIKND